MITKPLIVLLVIAGLTIPSLPQTRRNTIARPVSSLVPFDSTVEKLPAGFQGINLQDLLGQFVLRVRDIKRGEYETKDAYSKRISNLQDSTISGSLTLKSTLAFVLTPTTEYLPDNGELFAGVALHGSLSSDVGKQGVLRISGTHTTKRSVIQSSSGAKVPTTIDIQSNYALAIDRIDGNWTDGVVSKTGYGIHVKMSTAEAKTTRENLRILAVCSMVAPFVDSGESTVEPTPTQTQGESIIEQYAAVALHDLWLFDQPTGRILARAKASRPRSTVAENVPPKPKVIAPPETKLAEPLAATEELLLNGDKLPPEYTGTDPVLAWTELYKIGGGLHKDEFETSAQFEARFQESLKQTTIDRQPLNSVFGFQIDNPSFEYNADNESMLGSFSPDGYYMSHQIAKSTEVVILKRPSQKFKDNIYYLQISNLKNFIDVRQKVTFNFKIAAAMAKDGKPYMRVIAVCLLEKPFATQGYDTERCIHARVRFFLVYNFKTGEIYSRFPVSNNRKPIPSNPSPNSEPRSQKDRESAESHYEKAIAFAEAEDYTNAKNEMQRAVELVPNELRYNATMSGIYFQLQDFVSAERYANNAIKSAPEDWESYVLLGMALTGQGKIEAAETATRTSIRLSPNNEASHCLLGAILQIKGNLTEAESALKIAIKLDPDFSEAKDLLKQVQAQQKKPKN